jgi:myo-inositol-1(or 4)-monophosphatase
MTRQRATMSKSEIDTAVSLAREAGALIRDALERSKTIERKSPINLVTETDRAAEEIIVAGLHDAFPADTIIAEESGGGERPDGRAWVVDPLDGTTNFVHKLPHCAVSIGLLDADGPLAAVVYDPCKDELFSAESGAGAWFNGARMAVSNEPDLSEALLVTGFPYDRRVYSQFYLSYFEHFLHASLDLRRFGAAALDLCYVAAGRFDGFFEWKLHPWDTAAGWLIVEEAGGRVSDFRGAAYDPWGVRILATNGRIHDQAVAEFATLPEHPDDSPVD